ncbi:molybdopterin-dependent oxidoreductase [Variovorax sp. KK3]|uniref:molybdopterin-dependent oxidoreductase n=1 Tax=Variovorax sp. KK3 TaxID=1855728 RepID=UPI00097C1C50|nr:molybdopterin-dependent oxidoreductase [Variovorax sp. KK3]
MFRRRQLLTLAALGTAAQSCRSNEDGRALLVVRGSIRKFTDLQARAFEFTEEEYMSLPQTSITTATPWTPRSRFDGPLLSQVLAHVGASGSRVDVEALDSYRASIPMSDLKTFRPILAHSRNGNRMTARDHGPLFVMYPRDEYPKTLSTPSAQAKFIWQVRSISVVG